MKNSAEMSKKGATWTVRVVLNMNNEYVSFKFNKKQTLADVIDIGQQLLQGIRKGGKIEDSVQFVHMAKHMDKGTTHAGTLRDRLPDVEVARESNVVFSVLGRGKQVLHIRVRDASGKSVPGRKNLGRPVSGTKNPGQELYNAFLPTTRHTVRNRPSLKVLKCRKGKKNTKCRYVSRVEKDDGKNGECREENKQCLVSALRNHPSDYVSEDDWNGFWASVAQYNMEER